MNEIAKHPGTVISTTNRSVKVLITTLSACGSCSAHAHCGFGSSRDREIEIDTPHGQQYTAGQHVTVSVSEGLGFLAIFWAYLLPAILLLACIIILLITTHNEPLSILITLLVVALYYVVLYRFRDRLQHRFTFGIEPAEA